jgi:hypothetical protein
METINLTITCNGTETEIVVALKELIAEYEKFGSVYNYEDGTILAEIE